VSKNERRRSSRSVPQSLLGLSFARKSPLFADAKTVGSSRKLTAAV